MMKMVSKEEIDGRTVITTETKGFFQNEDTFF
jgi:hypothetical protein